MKSSGLVVLVIAASLMSCKTSELYLNVTEPAPVTIPSYVKKIAVIDRTAPTEEAKAIDVADKILSLEGSELDREGAAASITGLADELRLNKKFEEVKLLSDIEFRTPRINILPQPLSWDIVQQLCVENDADAIFSLEKFDTDTRIGYSNRNVDIASPLGIIPALEHQSDMETIVKTGWRIYDPSTKTLLDEYLQEETLTFHGKGVNPLAAAAGLIGRKDAVKEAGNKTGQNYALRIIPYEIRVIREYYVKGTDNFKIAERKAQMGKWDEAGELWAKELDNPSSKIAGRAAYNMAILSEINGKIEDALDWAQKAYEDYNNQLAPDYVHILENRRYQNQALDEQQ
ncbi:MAG TPA: DUF6340 family protein [Bacteroidales bacterium]|nr:DUF6340 family protein [Bacteroidales bacterium]